MKKAIYILLCVMSVVLGSCENDFDAKIYGQLSTTNFPESKTDYENYMLSCYLPFLSQWAYRFSYNQRQWYSATGGVLKFFDACSDEMAPWLTGSWGTGWTGLSSANFEDFKNVSRNADDNFPTHFEGIRDISRYTLVIKTLEEAPETALPDDIKRQYVGEARLLRGLMMYYMLHIYGPVPVIVDASKVGDAEAEKALVRPSLDEMTQYITDDFEYAADNMAETQSEQGRYTADYARVCLMRHYLNEGYHVEGYYQKAYDLFNKFHGSYSLYTDNSDGQNAYAEQFKIGHKFNSEVVMALSCNSDGDGSGKSGNFNPYSYYMVPNGAAKVDDQGNPTPFYLKGGGWQQTLNISKAFYDSFEDGDTRKETILTSYYSQTMKKWVTPSDLGNLWDGYIVNKYPIETNTNFQGTDVPLARWADVLLMRAEADVRAHGTVSSEAISLVNEVRHRAGLADLTTDKTANVSAFMDALLLERGHELYMEGLRKIDLIRFGKYYTIMSSIGKTPSSEYIPLPDYAVKQAQDAGYTLTQYYTRDNYDGPKK